MAQIEDIKAQLQQTSKGKLKYESISWNEISGETTKSPKVHVSPFTIKYSSRVKTTIQNQRTNNDFKVINWYSLDSLIKISPS